MSVECILIIEVESFAKMTLRVILFYVKMVRFIIIQLLLEHQYWLMLDAELTHSFPVIPLVMIAQLLWCNEFSHWFLMTKPADKTQFPCNINFDSWVLKPQVCLRIKYRCQASVDGIMFVCCNKHFVNEAFADWTLLLFQFDPLSKSTLPANLVVPTFSDRIQLYVFYTNNALSV